MVYIECPEHYSWEKGDRSIFLAGGITDCPDWQRIMADLMCNTQYILLNPRRKSFSLSNMEASREQILWEFEHLRKASTILFWFPRESNCPIALYELGAWSMTEKPMFLGVDSEYPRRLDIEIQTSLIRPEITIQYSLKSLADNIITSLQ